MSDSGFVSEARHEVWVSVRHGKTVISEYRAAFEGERARDSALQNFRAARDRLIHEVEEFYSVRSTG